jgi:Zn-dependent peptidase ImmA (M78 family)
MLGEIAQDELFAALDAVAGSALGAVSLGTPPVDAFAVAASCGMTVAWDDGQQGRARLVQRLGLRNPARAIILVKRDDRSERMQWSVGHELGELLAPRVFSHLGIDPREARPGVREQIANQLAGRILVPSDCFAGDAAKCGWDLPRLKKRYATASHELIARRMLECSPPVIITVFDHGRQTWRRSNAAGRMPPLSTRELKCWKAAHETGEATRIEGVQCWAVHEPYWRREIIRREVEEY